MSMGNLKEELGKEFQKYCLEMEKQEGQEGWGKYKEEMKNKYPLGFERHSFEEGLQKLGGWYFWNGREVQDLDGFKKFVDEYLKIVYEGFQNQEYYQDIGLDGFLMKMKQGDIFKIGTTTLFSVPASENIREIYAKGFDTSQYDRITGRLFGVLDCKNNRFMVENYDLDKLSLLLPGFKKEYAHDSPESRKVVKELYNITFLNEVFEEINNLMCRLKSDKVCANIENKRLIVKDLNLDFSAEYDDIQKLAMGINNHIYLSFKRLEDREIYKHTLKYLENDLDYLRELIDKEKVEDWRQKPYLDLVKIYSNIKGNVDKLIETEIKSAIKGKNSVYVNDRQFKEVYCYLSSEAHTGAIRGKYGEEKLNSVETIKYGKKEIFNREKAVERLSSAEFQAGINGLIIFVRNHFDRYNQSNLDIQNGDLVYTKNGHFGIVNKGKINLDDGKQEGIEATVICIKDNELNKGLRVMKEYMEFGRNKEKEIER